MDYPSFEKGFELLSVFNDEELLSIVGIEKKSLNTAMTKVVLPCREKNLRFIKNTLNRILQLRKLRKTLEVLRQVGWFYQRKH